ncbi:MAG: tRNA uridine-5-carboxymethylaminomethyl(34) synthesis GTPase MnmE [Lachnospiraceae bacterium]
MIKDTIAAIATGITNAGISIIRISGPESFSIVEKIFKTGKKGSKGFIDISKTESHTVHYGCIVDGDNIIDEVMVLVFKAPSSYTKEDVVEIDCHGGVMVTKRVLETVLNAGARIAEPGEFTKRAFLNGRIDLSQAEAVINLINSKNKMAIDNSVKQLYGVEFNKISEIRDSILHDTAFIEAALDDPEHIEIDGFSTELRENVLKSIDKLNKMIDSADNGRLMSEGINTVIVGKPNAGKSTLLNAILGEERAIVTDIEGTTRDTLEETAVFDGITLNIIDTAGIRNTEDIIEQMGVERALKAASLADLILYVVDSSRSLDDNDRRIIEKVKDRKVIVLINKTDIASEIDENIFKENQMDVIYISAKTGQGMDALGSFIKKMFFQGNLLPNDEVYITSMRHKECLVDAKKSLERVIESIDMEMSEDFFTIDLMNAYSSLGYIIGEETDEDLINKIFKDFCMGK